MHHRNRGGWLLVVAVALATPVTNAQDINPAGQLPSIETSPDALEVFEKHVRPTLVNHCINCHGPDKQRAGLRLDSRQGWSAGGDSGPAIVPGDAQSLLLKAIRYQSPDLEMPPRGKLPEATIRAIEKWVLQGAVDPRWSDSPRAQSAGRQPPTVEAGRSFWSFRPVVCPEVPPVHDPSWPLTNIDRFILARLDREGLHPQIDANPLTLLRRLHYDLIGLPPTPAQIRRFLDDPSPRAYEALVDRLLSSHHFGERWGRHWLDVVRFAESSGGGRTLLFPDAWRYRDYVIQSLNEDVPYNDFLRQQLAGDLLESHHWRQRARNLTATAFLLLGPTNYELQDKEVLEMDVIDEQIDTMGKAFLGLTLGCARCHDHKFDPIPTSDYYALAGILGSTQSLIHSNVSTWNTVVAPLSPEKERAYQRQQQRLAAAQSRLDATTQRWIAAGGDLDGKSTAKSIDHQRIDGIVIDDNRAELDGRWTPSTSIAGFVGAQYLHDGTEDKGSKSATYRITVPTAGRYQVFASYCPASNRSTRVPFHVHHADGMDTVTVNQQLKPPVDGAFTPLGVYRFDPHHDCRVVISNLGTGDGVVIADAIVVMETSGQSPLSRLATDIPQDRALLARLRKEVRELEREVKSIRTSLPPRPVLMATADAQSASDMHVAIGGAVQRKGPLTPRGAIQVASWEPFPEIASGRSGRAELAGWIADRRNPLTARVMVNRIWYWLMGQGIVPSVDNFGTMGERPSHPRLLDYLAHRFIEQEWSIKQLIREIVRSRVYRLSSQMSGSGSHVDPGNRWLWRMNRRRLDAECIRDSMLMVSGNMDFRYGGNNIKQGTKIEYGYAFDSTRRSVYVPIFRNALPEIFEVFDFADPNIQRGRRNVSTVASQSLLLMNHPQVIRQSEQAADRPLARCDGDTADRIKLAYLQVLGRPPTADERGVAMDLLRNTNENGSTIGWALLYQVLFQCIDFRSLD